MSNLTVNKSIEAKLSWEWIKSAFYTFRESPIHFIILSIFGIISGFIPLFGAFMAPLFTARFAFLAMNAEKGEKIRISSIFGGFFANLALLRLSFFNFTINAIFLIGQYFLELYLRSHGQAESIAQGYALLVFLLPLLILQVAMWVSPIICLNYPEIRPVAAMGLSIRIGLYNVITFLVYSLLVCAFTLLALIPVGLGLFIWIPVLNIASYYVYKTTIHKKM